MRYFFKVYVDGVRELKVVKRLGVERWGTLTVLMSFMNSDYQCWPTIATVADLLGVSEPTARRWIHELSQYEFNGKPLIVIEQFQVNGRGKWRNRYTFNGDFIDMFE